MLYYMRGSEIDLVKTSEGYTARCYMLLQRAIVLSHVSHVPRLLHKAQWPVTRDLVSFTYHLICKSVEDGSSHLRHGLVKTPHMKPNSPIVRILCNHRYMINEPLSRALSGSDNFSLRMQPAPLDVLDVGALQYLGVPTRRGV